MATYLILNIVVIAVVCLVLRQNPRRWNKPWLLTLAGLLTLTAVFDNVIILMDIVGYDPSKILGVYIGVAPIEDFMYALLAVIMVPALWHMLEKKHAK